MDEICISANASSRDMERIAMCVHELFARLPVTARSRNQPGVQIEGGQVKSDKYTGPVLEQALAEGRVIRGKPESGAYKGIPVVVAPIMANGKAIAAVGVVDTTGALDIKALMDQYSHIEKQVSGSR